MNKREIDYYISNGEFAMNYLQELSRTATCREECNKAFNHASAVALLIRTLKHLFKQNEMLTEQNNTLFLTVGQLQKGEFNELLEKERAKLQQEFEQMKKYLIVFINDYPDIER